MNQQEFHEAVMEIDSHYGRNFINWQQFIEGSWRYPEQTQTLYVITPSYAIAPYAFRKLTEMFPTSIETMHLQNPMSINYKSGLKVIITVPDNPMKYRNLNHETTAFIVWEYT